METSLQNMYATLIVMIVFIGFQTTVAAQGLGSEGDGGPGSSPEQPAGQSSGQGSDQQSTLAGYQYFINGDALPQRRSMLIAHAVMASLVWAFLIPLGGILLRLNLNSPWVIRLHMILQISSFLLYIAAVGLGIYLISTLGTYSPLAWQDAHPRLGLAILALASLQPFLGYVYHRVFKRNLLAARAGRGDKRPGRTIWAHMHLWLGRILIVLGCINGGLGLKLSGEQPAWLNPAPKASRIGYAASVTVTTGIYMIVVMMFEQRQRRNNRNVVIAASGEDSPQVDEAKIAPGMDHGAK